MPGNTIRQATTVLKREYGIIVVRSMVRLAGNIGNTLKIASSEHVLYRESFVTDMAIDPFNKTWAI